MLPHTVALASFSKPGFTGPRTAKATSCLRPRHDSAPLISDGFEAQFELKLNNRESGSTKGPCADGLPFCSGPDVYSGLSAELTGNELKRESIVDGAPCCSGPAPELLPACRPGAALQKSRCARLGSAAALIRGSPGWAGQRVPGLWQRPARDGQSQTQTPLRATLSGRAIGAC